MALEFLPQHLHTSDQDKARFVQEAKAAAALNHGEGGGAGGLSRGEIRRGGIFKRGLLLQTPARELREDDEVFVGKISI